MTEFLIYALQHYVVDDPKRSQADKDKAAAVIVDLQKHGAPVFDDEAYRTRFMRNEFDLWAVLGGATFLDVHPAGPIMDLVNNDEADVTFEGLATKEVSATLLRHGVDLEHTRSCRVCQAAFEPKWLEEPKSGSRTKTATHRKG